jgi:hypothetical protein
MTLKAAKYLYRSLIVLLFVLVCFVIYLTTSVIVKTDKEEQKLIEISTDSLHKIPKLNTLEDSVHYFEDGL